MEKQNKVEWVCLGCGKTNYSYRDETHTLNMCECGESGVDAEKHYIRQIGNVRILEE